MRFASYAWDLRFKGAVLHSDSLETRHILISNLTELKICSNGFVTQTDKINQLYLPQACVCT